MVKHLKKTLGRLLPGSIKNIIVGAIHLPILTYARIRFNFAKDSPEFLDMNRLKQYQESYPEFPPYSYDLESLRARGIERANFLMTHLVPGKEGLSILEIGAGDGMVSWKLRKSGHSAYAIDQSSDMICKEALNEGVVFKEMDASDLEFTDETFDLIFSYNSFEHFHDPEQVLREMTRVLRKGGHMYHSFEPINSSAFGLHAYRSIKVPFCQYLFSRATMDEFCEANELQPINYGQLNLWTTTQFRELWAKFRPELEVIRYKETKNFTSLDLICRHPSCFKGKAKSFDDLVVSGMELIMKKRDHVLS
jgi:ubiquinone/menaquinone biosynthesis C-methylase UbiE